MNYENYDKDEYYEIREKKNAELVEALAWFVSLIIVSLVIYGIFRLFIFITKWIF
jgi:hypothetical protein